MASRMSFVWCSIALTCATMATIAMAATTHVVGGDDGWKIPTDAAFYATWVGDKTFNVGDKLEFKWMGVHNVAAVSKEEYEGCTKAGTPETTSPVTIPLESAGTKYFICSVGTHCSLGQKLSVTVGASGSKTPAASAPTSNSSSATPAAPGPTTNPSAAPASLLSNALSVTIFAVGSIFFAYL